jgi:Ribose 5-phosphate isomerase A (phosphoriboisomerase A)
VLTELHQYHRSADLKRPSDLRRTPRLTNTFNQRIRYVIYTRDTQVRFRGDRRKVIGIGSGKSKFDSHGSTCALLQSHIGSTVPYVVERILQQGKELNKDRIFIPTSFQASQLITTSGLRLGDITQYPELDVTVDGADE